MDGRVLDAAHPRKADPRSAGGSAYAAFWRWHFYAGLLVAPFLLILAVTGAIYLFNDELNDWIYPELRFVPGVDASVPAGRLLDAVRDRYPGGRVTRLDFPEADNRSATAFVTTAGGAARRVFLDPHSGAVLGSFVYEHTLVGLADTLHGSLMLGTVGDAVVEIAACWAVILVITGAYLWWPRRRGTAAGVWYPRLRAPGGWTRRRFWRDLHAVTGIYVAALVLFLVMTGLPWASVWGGMLLRPATAALGLGYPAAQTRPPASNIATGTRDTPWALETASVPRSTPLPHHGAPVAKAAAAPDIDIDAITQQLAARGIDRGYRLSLPAGPRGVYTALVYPDRPQGQRTIHLDRYSGAVLADVGYAGYGPVGRAVELGVALHMGNYFGRANQLVMLTACIAIVMLVISGVTMWWRRRPTGGFGAPPRRPVRMRHFLTIVAAMGLLFPLAGASLVVVWLGDRLVVARRARSSAA